MEAVKYILNFFFGPGCGWHFLGLCVLLLCASPKSSITNTFQNIKKDEEK